MLAKECVILTLDIFEKNLSKSYFPNVQIIIFPHQKYKSSKIKDSWREGLYLSKWISQQLSYNRYFFYTIHDQVFLSKYLSTHKRCSGYFYIEEGMGSMNVNLSGTYTETASSSNVSISTILGFKIPLIGKLKISLKDLLPVASYLTPNHLFSQLPKFIGTYAISKDAFNWISNTKIVECKFPEQKEELFLQNAPIFIFDNLVASQICKFSTLQAILEKILIAGDYKELNVKFHPLQPPAEIREWTEFLNSKVPKLHIIRNDIILEAYFEDHRLELIGFVSSLLYYNCSFSSYLNKSTSYIKDIFLIEKKTVPPSYKEVIRVFTNNKVKVL